MPSLTRLAASALDNDAPSGRRLHIAGADGCGRVDDDSREPVLSHHLVDQTFSKDFALLVCADGLVFRKRVGFVDWRIALYLERRDTAGVDDALDTGAQRLLHETSSAFKVGSENLVRGW